MPIGFICDPSIFIPNTKNGLHELKYLGIVGNLESKPTYLEAKWTGESTSIKDIVCKSLVDVSMLTLPAADRVYDRYPCLVPGVP